MDRICPGIILTAGVYQLNAGFEADQVRFLEAADSVDGRQIGTASLAAGFIKIFLAGAGNVGQAGARVGKEMPFVFLLQLRDLLPKFPGESGPEGHETCARRKSAFRLAKPV